MILWDLQVAMCKGGGTYLGKPLFSPHEIRDLEYDAIVVATIHAEEVRQVCMEVGIDMSKVIFVMNHHDFVDYNQDYEFIERILGHDFCVRIKSRDHVIVGVDTGTSLCLQDMHSLLEKDVDYVRYQTFQLVVEEIRKRNLPGSVAEAGVFRGDFAQYINCAFPGKHLYLFDSFEGFAKQESEQEKSNKQTTTAMIEAHKNASIEVVMSKMINREMADIRKGFIPETFAGLEEETYCFVSLDVDFGESILAGLRYFYPRLVSGGYIFVHDYHNGKLLSGVGNAVAKYEQEIGSSLAKVPLCDINGTLVITK